MCTFEKDYRIWDTFSSTACSSQNKETECYVTENAMKFPPSFSNTHLLKEVIYMYKRIHHLLKFNFFKKGETQIHVACLRNPNENILIPNTSCQAKFSSVKLCPSIWTSMGRIASTKTHTSPPPPPLCTQKTRIATCRHNTGAINNPGPPCRPRMDTWISRCGLHVVERRRHCLWPRYVARSDTSAVMI